MGGLAAGGGDLEIREAAGTLGQAVCRGVAAAADDVASLLEGCEPAARCIFMVWALKVGAQGPGGWCGCQVFGGVVAATDGRVAVVDRGC